MSWPPIKAERIWVEDGCEYPNYYADESEDCTEYVRIDLVVEKDNEIATLRQANALLIEQFQKLESAFEAELKSKDDEIKELKGSALCNITKPNIINLTTPDNSIQTPKSNEKESI